MAHLVVSIKKQIVQLKDGKARKLARADRLPAHESDDAVTINVSDGPFTLPRALFDSLVESGIIVIEQNGAG